jgi:hypothetical protein
MPTLTVLSAFRDWKQGESTPRDRITNVPNHLYHFSGTGWTPGTMVFCTFEHLRDEVEEPTSQAGPSAMVDPRGNFHCW